MGDVCHVPGQDRQQSQRASLEAEKGHGLDNTQADKAIFGVNQGNGCQQIGVEVAHTLAELSLHRHQFPFRQCVQQQWVFQVHLAEATDRCQWFRFGYAIIDGVDAGNLQLSVTPQ